MRNIVAIMMLLWYDGMGRLVESTVKQGTSEVAVKPVFPPLEPAKAAALLLPADHSEKFTYDLNANVLTIERKGRRGSVPCGGRCGDGVCGEPAERGARCGCRRSFGGVDGHASGSVLGL